MKNAIILVVVALALLASVPQAPAQEFPQRNDDYVNDFAGVFNQSDAGYLRSLLFALRENTTAEVVVVTVATVAPLEPSQYATELFTRWGIGKKEKDNGLLILYSKGENKIWVTTGYGMEGVLPDSRIGRMLDDYYVPSRDAGNPASGIVQFTKELSAVIYQNADEIRTGGGSLFPGLALPFAVGMLFYYLPVFIVAIVFFSYVVNRLFFTPKCPNDGSRMQFVRNEGNYAIYQCPKCHAIKKKRKKLTHSGFIYAGGIGGGFGGGGFGGGGTGGGGAGR